MSEEKTYTMEEMDIIMGEYIKEQSEVLRKNLRVKRKSNTVEYV